MKFLKVNKYRLINWAVIISLILSFLLVISSGTFTSNNPCANCHRRLYEYCTLLPNDAASFLPQEIGITSTSIKIAVEISGSTRNRYYEIDELKVTLQSKQGTVVIDQPEQKVYNLYPGDKVVLNWQVTGTEKGLDTLEFLLSAYNPHRNSHFVDQYSYAITIIETTLPEKTTAIEPSAWTILLDKEKSNEAFLHVKRDVTDIRIDGFDGIDITPSSISKASSGEDLQITFLLLEDRNVSGNAIISWLENGTRDKISVYASYYPLLGDSNEYFLFTGRVTGIILFILLIFSMILGGITKRITRYINQGIGNKNRIRGHCFISWFLFVLSIFHGFILLIQPYKDFLMDYKIILGDLTCLSILMVSVNGSFMKQIIKLLGSNLWRRLHQVFSWSSVILVVVHALLIGTDFLYIRELLGI